MFQTGKELQNRETHCVCSFSFNCHLLQDRKPEYKAKKEIFDQIQEKNEIDDLMSQLCFLVDQKIESWTFILLQEK